MKNKGTRLLSLPFKILICVGTQLWLSQGAGVAAAGDPKVYFNLGGSQENILLMNKNEKLTVIEFE